MNGQDPKAEIFDVFLCHNSDDKPAVREIAQQLVNEGIKPFLDEADIRPADSWSTALGEQIKTVKSAAVFFGSHGVSRWQDREITALLNESDRRRFPVIPVILTSDTKPVVVPWSLEGLHWVDFRETNSQPLKRLIWGITGQKPMELADVPTSEKPTTIREVVKSRLIACRGQQAVSGDTIPKTRLYPPLAQPPDQEQGSQLEILRGRVEEYWVDGVLSDSLKNQPPISLRKRKIDRAIDAPWKYQAQLSDSISPTSLDDRDLNAIYEATGLLLILGEPGSGKTTTMLDLTRTLLDRARDHIKERVPVVVNLSTWKNRQPLVEWISGELSEKYRVPRKIARFWLQQNYLLPLLDGLDEVETSTQPDCVAAINAFVEEFNPSGLVVCCRLNEYRWLPERLKLNGAVCLEPLTTDEIEKYLAEGGPKLAPLREAMNTDAGLRELAQTPLMLSVMSLAFQGIGAEELAGQKGKSTEDRRKQIFRLYVEQMFRLKGKGALVFPKERTIGWLSWLAGNMRKHSQSTFLVEGLESTWLGTAVHQASYGLSVGIFLALITSCAIAASGGTSISGTMGLSVLIGVTLGCWSKFPIKNGITSGLIVWLIIGLSYARLTDLATLARVAPKDLGQALTDSLINGFTVGLLTGMLMGLTGWLGVGSLNRVTLVETLSWRWDSFFRKTAYGFVLGLIFGLILGAILGSIHALSYWQEYKTASSIIRQMIREALLFGILFGIFGGLIGGVTIGLIGGFVDAVERNKIFPNQGIVLSLKNSAIAFLVTSLIYALIVLLLDGLIFRGFELGVWLNIALFAALVAGLNRGGSAVIKHYALRLVLWLSGYTPFNFIKFLDHCAKLIFLKKVGGGYIFIHRMLLDYFADIPPQ